MDALKAIGWAFIGLIVMGLLVVIGWAVANIGMMLSAFALGLVVGCIAVLRCLRKK